MSSESNQVVSQCASGPQVAKKGTMANGNFTHECSIGLGEPLSSEVLEQLFPVSNGGRTGPRIAPASALEAAHKTLQTFPIPSASHELWRQTSPELFPLESLITAEPIDVRIAGSGSITEQGPSLPEGVEWDESPVESGTLLEDIFGSRAADLSNDTIAQLVLAASSGGGILRVRSGVTVTQPLKLSQVLASRGTASGVSREWRSAAPVLVVVVESGASCTVLEDLDESFTASEIAPREGSGGGLHSSRQVFYAPRVEVLIDRNAQCEFVSVQRLPEQCTYMGRHRFHLLRDAHLKTVHIAIGAQSARLDLDCKLYESGANADLYSLYLANGTRHVDFHTTQRHLAPHCRSNLYCKGAATDQSRSVYFGYIRVAEHAQKTDAYQKNRNLLLSDDARTDAIPNLEILANDVKCSHGASVGQVGAEELFYLMSRGISRTEAERILVQAFFEDLVAKIENPFVKEYVEEVVAAIFSESRGAGSAAF